MEFFKTDEEARAGMRSQYRGTGYAIENQLGYDVFCHDFTPIYIGATGSKADCQRFFESWRSKQQAERAVRDAANGKG